MGGVGNDHSQSASYCANGRAINLIARFVSALFDSFCKYAFGEPEACQRQSSKDVVLYEQTCLLIRYPCLSKKSAKRTCFLRFPGCST